MSAFECWSSNVEYVRISLTVRSLFILTIIFLNLHELHRQQRVSNDLGACSAERLQCVCFLRPSRERGCRLCILAVLKRGTGSRANEHVTGGGLTEEERQQLRASSRLLDRVYRGTRRAIMSHRHYHSASIGLSAIRSWELCMAPSVPGVLHLQTPP